MTRINIQKNCEVLNLKKDPEKEGVYNVKPLFTNTTDEFSPETHLNIKGSPKEVAKILSFLGEQFSKNPELEKTLAKTSIAPLSFEVRENHVIAKDAHGKELKEIEGDISSQPAPAKVNQFIRKFFPAQDASQPSSKLLTSVSEVRALWAKVNTERTSTEKRVEIKISLLEDFICNLGRQKGMSEEDIEAGLDALSGATSSYDYLNQAKNKYFPELSDELHELQMCEECKDHLKLSYPS